jgi:hypothetical protein
VEHFLYYLTKVCGAETATPTEIKQCFWDCDLSPPGNVSQLLANGLSAKPARIVRRRGGYKLHRKLSDAIAANLNMLPEVVQTSSTLRSLEQNFPEGNEKDFLDEAIRCFEVGADRAAIIMVWLLTMSHLQSYILASHRSAFNAVLAKNNDKRIRVKSISHIDDFSDIPENKFIEFCRSAGIISNDVRKILIEKLGTRNSSAHPSAVKINQSKVIDFVEDLVVNVLLKYQI